MCDGSESHGRGALCKSGSRRIQRTVDTVSTTFKSRDIFQLTKYQIKLRCIICTLSSVNRKHTASPLPYWISRPRSLSVICRYSSNSSSSSPGGPPLLKKAHKKNSFKLSLWISSSGAPRNHFRRYSSGSPIYLLHNLKSSLRSAREGGGGWIASRWR